VRYLERLEIGWEEISGRLTSHQIGDTMEISLEIQDI
jgi:hypothetical protein